MKAVKAFLFDFGGVIANEGFHDGLVAIARKLGLDPGSFFAKASDLTYDTGYVLGRCTEQDYWNALREKTGIRLTDDELRTETFGRFAVRDDVLAIVKSLRRKGFILAILSDQVDWLDEIESNHPFYHLFDYVFNSYKLHKGKRDATIFTDVCDAIGVKPAEAVMIDDNAGHISRAAAMGIGTILCTNVESIRKGLAAFIDVGRDIPNSTS